MRFQAMVMGLRALVVRRRVESEMEKEMRLHLELETEENLRRGMSPVAARRAAMIAFGGVEKNKEAVRDERSTRLLEQVVSDGRFALRGMGRQPGFTLAVILLLALGTGANTAIFSVVDEMILRPLPFAAGDRMVQLTATAGGGQFEITPSMKLIDLWRARGRTVEEITVYGNYFPTFGDTSRQPARTLYGAAITPGMMKFTSMRPAIGRDILPADTLTGAPSVAILGHALWSKDFGGSREVLGTTVLLDGRSHTIVGVAAREFFVPFGGNEVFVAMRSDPKRPAANAIAKTRAGYTTADATRELSALAPIAPPDMDLVKDPPKITDGSSLTRASTKRLVFMLFGAVGFVLLIACANVANLMLSRAWSRQREFAVRGAMGAGRGRIARQLFTESLLLAALGGAVGFFVAIALLRGLQAIQPENIGMSGRIDGTVLGWTVLISIFTGLLFGIAPALLIGDGRLGDVLKASARVATGSMGTRRLRSTLVIVEVALSVVLLIGAGLLVRSLAAMQRADLGMAPRGLASVTLYLPRDYTDSIVRRAAWIHLLNRVAATPGIDAATYALTMPPDFAAGLTGIEIEGRPLGPGDSISAIEFNLGSADLFRIAGLRFIEGRPFVADHRLSETGAMEIVINERLARRFWTGRSALGARIKRQKTWATVVGVVDNVDVPGVKGLQSGIQVYQSMSAAPGRASLVVKSALPTSRLEPVLRDAIKQSGVRVSVRGVSGAEEQINEGRATHRFTLSLIGGFALLAVLLAAIGLHAVISYSVSQRLREIGIRIALGAQSSQVAGLVLRQGVTLAAVGVVVGGLAALALTRTMRSLLYGVEPGDPLTIALVGAGLMLVSTVAAALPARRATRVDPVEMVRTE